MQTYFNWLYAKVGSLKDKNPSHTKWLLCEHLFNEPFTFFVPNDENRACDGLDLRGEYDEDTGHNSGMSDAPVTVFEMLIAFAERAAYEDSYRQGKDSVRYWFWRGIDNLSINIDDETYANNPDMDEYVSWVLGIFLDRKYEPSGKGGLFPLSSPKQDQRKVELWYQLAAYVLENSDIGD